MVFKKAERKQVKLKLAITGPSGSGKTYSALRLAAGMGAKIALVDTEKGSASLYADKFNFDTVNIDHPYTVEKYMDAIRAAESAGYDILIIDSITQAWAGDGGLLAQKESLDQRGGNSYTNWSGITKRHEAFKSALLNSDIHLICTMRSKQDYVLETNDKGKQAPKKVGLAPIQREGMEYEFTTVFDCAMDHAAIASKDRTGLFDGQIAKITEETGKALIAWLSSAKPAEVTAQPPIDDVDPPKQEAPKAPEPLKSTGSQVPCDKCGKECVEHHTKAGYICPDRKGKDDGHTAFSKADLEKMRTRAKTLGLNKAS